MASAVATTEASLDWLEDESGEERLERHGFQTTPEEYGEPYAWSLKIYTSLDQTSYLAELSDSECDTEFILEGILAKLEFLAHYVPMIERLNDSLSDRVAEMFGPRPRYGKGKTRVTWQDGEVEILAGFWEAHTYGLVSEELMTNRAYFHGLIPWAAIREVRVETERAEKRAPDLTNGTPGVN